MRRARFPVSNQKIVGVTFCIQCFSLTFRACQVRMSLAIIADKARARRGEAQEGKGLYSRFEGIISIVVLFGGYKHNSVLA